ncbi:MAG: GTP-binding protein [Promethearchaeota archaeon]
MVLNRNQIFSTLFNNFLSEKKEVVAVILSDEQGLMLAGEKRKELDMEIIAVLTSIINPILQRIRNEFAFQKFGSASFDTDQHRLLFISIDESTTLSLVLDSMASIDKIAPYGYFLAEKSAQILEATDEDIIQVSIPNFKHEAEENKRLKNQIYQLRLDYGGKYRFKFIIIGDHEVGKTSLIKQFVEKKFSHDYRATIGINITTHSIQLFGNEIIFSLWDIGAQEYFRRVRRTYYNGSKAAFIVFSLTDRTSFENVKTWFDELMDFIPTKDIPIIIVGNKMDLEDQRMVSYQEGMKLASSLGMKRISYIETSALTGANVEDAFSLIAFNYIQKIREDEERRLQEELLKELNLILEKKKPLTLAFITESTFWNPGLQIICEIIGMGQCVYSEDKKEWRIYEFSNGLVVRSHLPANMKVADANGILCIFDARGKAHAEPNWREIIIRTIKEVEENTVILVGIPVSSDVNWSQLLEELDVSEYLEKKMVSVLFFKIGFEYELEIYDQLKVMLSTINSLIF